MLLAIGLHFYGVLELKNTSTVTIGHCREIISKKIYSLGTSGVDGLTNK